MEITEILTELKISFVTEGQHRHCRNGWINFDCPFCGKDTNKFHMGYSISGGYTNCWRCGSHSLISSLIEHTGLSKQTIEKLLDGLPLVTTSKKDEPEYKRNEVLLPKGLEDLSTPHKRYLKSRGFDIEEIQRLWKIQGISIAPKLSWRIFIPIFYHGEIVSWTTRSISDDVERRYIDAGTNEERMKSTDLLYGEDFVRHAVVICEGPLDAWKIGPGAVAITGLSFTPKQMSKMVRYPVRAVCFDNEVPAQKRANHLVDQLSIYPGTTYNIQLDSKDAGCATKKEIQKIRKILE